MADSGGTFFERTDVLQELVGEGTLTGSVVVDQVYAQFQHEGLDLNHPRGGQAKFLEAPLVQYSDDYLQQIAERILEEGPDDAMASVMEDLAGEVSRLAPVDFNNLRRSANPRVFDGEQVIYDRPAEQRRLTEEELRNLRRARDQQQGRIRRGGLGAP